MAKKDENTVVSRMTIFASSLNERINQILNRESEAEVFEENGTELSVLTVNLKHNLASGASTLAITNPTTISVVERLQKLGEIESLTPSVKCVELARIADSVKDEFGMSIETFAYSVFGLSKSTALQYARIGKYFYNEQGGMKGTLPFLTTSQIIPLLARLSYADKEKGILAENPLGWIENAFRANKDGNSLLHASDSASDIKKALKAFDSGMLDINGICPLTEEQIQQKKAQEKANRKIHSAQNAQNGKEAETEFVTPKAGFVFELGNLMSNIDSVVSAFDTWTKEEKIAEGTKNTINHAFELLQAAVNTIVTEIEK